MLLRAEHPGPGRRYLRVLPQPQVPSRSSAQARYPLERRAAPGWDVHLDHPERTHLHHRTHRIPDI